MAEPLSKRTLRIVWLKAHPEIVHYTRQTLLACMTEEGLISTKTNACDVNLPRLLTSAGYPSEICNRFKGPTHAA